LKRDLYVQLIYLAIYPSIAGKEKEGNRDMKQGGERKKGGFTTRDHQFECGKISKRKGLS